MRILSFLLLITVLFFSCSDDENTTVIDYTKGTFIVNQGLFQSGTGTITFQGETSTVQDVFGKANNGAVLGNIAQSMIKHNDKYYIAINNANKIQVVNAKTFIKEAEITDISYPRYFASNGSKLYVSSWASDFIGGAVYEINTANNSLSAPINTGLTAEFMIIHNNKLYVALTTVFAPADEVVVVDISNNTIVNNIKLSDNPNSFAVDAQNRLWVLCSGNPDFTTPTNSTNGALYRLSADDQPAVSINLPPGPISLAVNNAGTELYFLMEDKIFKHNVADNAFKNESIYDGFYNFLAIHPSNDRLYFTDPLDYQTNGFANYIIPNSSTTGRINAGIVPGFVYFSE